MEIPSSLPTTQHSLLPTTSGAGVVSYREDRLNEDAAGERSGLSNDEANTQHHIIGDSDDEVGYSDTERKHSEHPSAPVAYRSSEEQRRLLGRSV